MLASATRVSASHSAPRIWLTTSSVSAVLGAKSSMLPTVADAPGLYEDGLKPTAPGARIATSICVVALLLVAEVGSLVNETFTIDRILSGFWPSLTRILSPFLSVLIVPARMKLCELVETIWGCVRRG